MASNGSGLTHQAEQYLRAVLQGCPAGEVPGRIISLATAPDDNPLKELVRASDPHASLAPRSSDGRTQPASHKNKFSLRFSRNKDRSKAGCSSQQGEKEPLDYQTVFQADVKPSLTDLDPVQQHAGRCARDTVSPLKTKSLTTAATYNCVFCRTDYTTKGTCKRHLEEIHVAKRYFRCIACSHKFNTAPEARKHCQTCGAGLLGYKTEIPEKHRIYSSEFELHKIFQKQQDYVDHLLDLSVVTGESRPVRSYHKKLRNLLERPACDKPLRVLSLRLFSSEDGWRNARWEHERVKKAVRELEQGIVEHESESGNAPALHQVEKFLGDLFRDRAMSTTVTAEAGSPIREQALPDTEIEVQPEPSEDRKPESRPTEHTPKRPLSFESSIAAPVRRPPGPPTPEAHNIQRRQQQQHHPQYGYQRSSMPYHAHPQTTISNIPETPYHTSIPTHGHPSTTQQVDQSLMFWPPPGQQPPPYEGTFTHGGNMGQPTYTSIPPNQDLTAMDYNSEFLPFADLSVASAITSPMNYMQTAEETMDFYSRSPQQFQQTAPEQQLANSAMMRYPPMGYAPGPAGYQTSGASHFDPSQYRFDGNM